MKQATCANVCGQSTSVASDNVRGVPDRHTCGALNPPQERVGAGDGAGPGRRPGVGARVVDPHRLSVIRGWPVTVRGSCPRGCPGWAEARGSDWLQCSRVGRGRAARDRVPGAYLRRARPFGWGRMGGPLVRPARPSRPGGVRWCWSWLVPSPLLVHRGHSSGHAGSRCHS